MDRAYFINQMAADMRESSKMMKDMDRAYYTYSDGSRYEGEFRDDKKHGQGIL